MISISTFKCQIWKQNKYKLFGNVLGIGLHQKSKMHEKTVGYMGF